MTGKKKRGLEEPDIEKIKNGILGKQYELSFSFINKAKIQSLNKKYRGKNQPTDILSFPLEKNSGEILICREIADKKSKEFGLTANGYLVFLLVHGLLHLKGLDHGQKMEELEKKYLKKLV